MDDKNEIREKIERIIRESLKLEEDQQIPSKDLFLNLGIDSLMALELLVSIEQEFDIEIDDEDLNVDLLSSIDNLQQYIYNKKISEGVQIN